MGSEDYLSQFQTVQALGKEPNLDAVILDVKMPGMDGIQTLKNIKTNHPLVEVIMLTGHATVGSAIDGMKLGALDYLMKPCDLDVLLAKVKEAKDKKDKHPWRKSRKPVRWKSRCVEEISPQEKHTEGGGALFMVEERRSLEDRSTGFPDGPHTALPITPEAILTQPPPKLLGCYDSEGL